MTTMLDVDAAAYWDAARGLDAVIVPRLVGAVDALDAGLRGCAGMAGSDPGGASWAGAYDVAADVAVRAARGAANACVTVRGLLGGTGDNYYRAELASVPGGGLPHVGWVPGVYGGLRSIAFAGGVSLPSAAAAAGGLGLGGVPTGWSLIEHVVGYVWPNGDPGRLRATGSAWWSAADGFDAAVGGAWPAVSGLYRQVSPEAGAACDVFDRVMQQTTETGLQLRRLGAACDELAGHIEALHAAVEHELVSFAWQSAAIEGGGLLLTVVTIGGSDLVAQAAEGSRVAALAARVTLLIERFVEAARVLAASLPTISTAAEAAAASLGRVIDMEPAVAGVTTVRALRLEMTAQNTGRAAVGASTDQALAATQQLLREFVPGRVVRFTTKAEARAAMPEPYRTDAREFFKGATGKCSDYLIEDLPDGTRRISYFAPADNSGYGKRYVSLLDRSGIAIDEYKDGIGPDGIYDRKWPGTRVIFYPKENRWNMLPQ